MTRSRYVDKLPFLRTLVGCMIMALLLGGGKLLDYQRRWGYWLRIRR